MKMSYVKFNEILRIEDIERKNNDKEIPIVTAWILPLFEERFLQGES